VPTTPIPIVTSIAEVGASRPAWFVDVWGVVHDGVHPFPGAMRACRTFRRRGGRVVLVSNAPRPHSAVRAQLDKLGVPADSYDSILTSGDTSRALIAAYTGREIVHVGPERDRPLFEGLDITLRSPAEASEAAVAVVCTGLHDDERETAETYRPVLDAFCARDLPMVCANPDLVVERGGRLIPCAGALAALYATLGGRVGYAGKPYLPIYEAAHQAASQLAGRLLAKSDLLAIGDGLHTDIVGAHGYGIASVYIASAVALGNRVLDAPTLAAMFPAGAPRPVAAMTALDWT
jgi:HAD superfamily hydrolase (TIGR01459 family)